MSPLACVVLAAGKGTRMRSARPKVLHPLAGRPMVEHVLANARALGPERTVLVVGPELAAFAARPGGAGWDRAGLEGAGGALDCVVQDRPLGTAHAVAQARPLLEEFGGDVLVLYADTPLLPGETMAGLLRARREGPGAVAAVLGFRPDDPAAYGRLILAPDGTLARIVEHAEAGEAEHAVALCNAGAMAVDGRRLFPLLDAIGNDNRGGEYYLTDLPAIVAAQGGTCAVAEAPAEEVMGINDRVQLAAAERILQDRLRRAAMEGGATLVDPATVWLSLDTRAGRRRDHRAERGDRTRRNRRGRRRDRALQPSRRRARAEERGTIGPFARLRPGSDVGDGARVGNFVEVKNSTVAQGARINHLSYVGDAGKSARAPTSAPAPSPATMTATPSRARRSARAPSSARTLRWWRPSPSAPAPWLAPAA